MNKVKRLQIGEDLDFFSLSYNTTKETLQKLLEDPKYKKNVQKLSKLIQDQKEKPLDHAIWWIEWLLRNPNLDNLQSPVNTLGYIAGNALDVIAVHFLLHLFILSIILYFSYKKIIKLLSNQVTSFKKTKKHRKQS